MHVLVEAHPIRPTILLVEVSSELCCVFRIVLIQPQLLQGWVMHVVDLPQPTVSRSVSVVWVIG